MKVFLMFLISTSVLFAQEERRTEQLSISVHDINLGYGLKVEYARALNENWQVNSGIYFHFNYLARDNQSYGFYNRGWADKWYEHIGFNLGAQRKLWHYQASSVNAFYDALFMRPSLRKKYPIYKSTPSGNIYLEEGHFIHPPIFAVENTFGINIQTLLSERWGFFMKAGIGLALYYDGYRDEPRPAVLWTDDFQGIYTLAGGFYYTF